MYPKYFGPQSTCVGTTLRPKYILLGHMDLGTRVSTSGPKAQGVHCLNLESLPVDLIYEIQLQASW